MYHVCHGQFQSRVKTLSCFDSGPLDEDDQPHGVCKVTYSSGDRFEGHFTHGEKNGNGKFFFFDGRYF